MYFLPGSFFLPANCFFSRVYVSFFVLDRLRFLFVAFVSFFCLEFCVVPFSFIVCVVTLFFVLC